MSPNTIAVLNNLKVFFPEFVANLLESNKAEVEEILPPVSEDELNMLEAELGLPLPRSYKQFLTVTRGFWLFGGAVQISREHPSFHNFQRIKQLSASQEMLCFAEYFLHADGDQVLFDVSDGLIDGEYPVMYYSHEEHTPTVTKISDSFQNFLNKRCINDFEA